MTLRARCSSAASALAIAAACLLTGCGNAYERITVSEWQEAGENERPGAPPSVEYTVETTTEGSGRLVNAADLVKARLTTPDSALPRDFWIWVGRAPAMEYGQDRSTSAWFGNLGSARFRDAIVGRRLGDKIVLRGMFNPEGTDLVPVYAIAIGDSGSSRLFQVVVRGEVLSSPEWPQIMLSAPRNTPEIVAEIEIQQACPAKLYRRTGTLRQWGVPLRFATGRPKSSRRGELGWSKIEAHCPPPAGRVTMLAGPFYVPVRPDENELLDWSGSYAGLRPPSEFPEEWLADRARTGME